MGRGSRVKGNLLQEELGSFTRFRVREVVIEPVLKEQPTGGSDLQKWRVFVRKIQ